MDQRDDTRDRDRVEDEEPAERVAGDVLGVSRVTPGTGLPGIDRDRNRGEEEGAADAGPSADERSHVGSRDVTEGTTGGTGPDTGGSGVFRRGSGASGTDIGK
jgi:hypothetical protein